MSAGRWPPPCASPPPPPPLPDLSCKLVIAVAPPDPNSKPRIRLAPAGPQLQVRDRSGPCRPEQQTQDQSGPCRTSTASARSQWSLPGPNSKPRIRVAPAGPHRSGPRSEWSPDFNCKLDRSAPPDPNSNRWMKVI